MVNHYRISLFAANVAQAAAMAHAYEHSSNTAMAKVYNDNAVDDFVRIAHELGYRVEKIAEPALRAAA
ncbi:hypothetical protein HBA91_00890 [Ochrobactrum sp. MR34]|nr:hypothetical protein [Ochrobactrum sp. MR34]